jgi:CO/xanthine dehydrogenase FAD-binding subunit
VSSSVDEAVQILDRFGGEAKVLAGGRSLLPVMKLRLAEPRALVDINRIPDLTQNLAHLGVTHIDISMTPWKVWKILHEKRAA